MIEFCSLGSGSRGNALLVRTTNTCVLVDCGFGLREFERRLERSGMHPRDIDAILVTHEHSDHIGGVAALARRHDYRVHATSGTARAAGFDGLRVEVLLAERRERIGDIDVLPVTVPHDAREPCQFVLGSGGRTLGVLTDLGCVTQLVRSCYSACDALLLESNHDSEMLANGAYPRALKQRVAGPYGHLSNTQAAQLLSGVERGALQHVVAGHLSEQNNAAEVARVALGTVLSGSDAQLHLADQGFGSGWLRIE